MTLPEICWFFSGLKHVNLVALLGVVIDDAGEIFMVTEHMANGNLASYLTYFNIYFYSQFPSALIL